ncbi:IS701 family transposase [Nocardia terpenica]|uniref:Transposase n=1 Tax=Nocardia terpenica TaxID=455432 RepID=A0A6G9ZEP3_9NOCA|nr:transposase [Nocardia terpenica]QIS23456.1 transposase [Nocardia terpenica]QIS23463.1 transposase [Nocardia terpenica]
MLPDPTLPASLLIVVGNARGCFTGPSFRVFCVLVAGLVTAPGRATVCAMLAGAGLGAVWPHQRVHRFFSAVPWCPDLVGIVLSHMVIRLLIAEGVAVTVVVDDTLFERTGPKVFGAAWQHDGAAKAAHPVGYGTCFVVLGVLVWLPFCVRPVCLPVLARLWRPGGEHTKVELAAVMIRRFAAAHRHRRVHVVADGAYHGPSLRGLPDRLTFTTRAPVNAVLFELPPPRTGRCGRPRLKGQRLGAREVAAIVDTTGATVTRYRHRARVRIGERRCLWYGSWHTRVLRLIVVAEIGAAAKTTPLLLLTTDLDTPAKDLITRYSHRWSIEVTFEQARAHLAAGQAQVRTHHAVERTVPFALYCYTIITCWYTLYGYQTHDIAERRAQAPWYTSKTEPAFADMIGKLRRVIIAARFSAIDPAHPTDTEIRAVQHAWAAASTNAA